VRYPFVSDPKPAELDPTGRWYDRCQVVLAAFLAGLVLAFAATAYAGVRGLGLWRVARGTGERFQDELALFEERSARTERLLAEGERASRDLELALARLRASQAQLNVLRSALERSLQRVRWLRAFVPGL
jgi:hypothetical protein